MDYNHECLVVSIVSVKDLGGILSGRLVYYLNMKIGIDARFYGPVGKGLGRYTQKLLEYLEKEEDTLCESEKNDYVVFLRKENFDEYQPQSRRFVKVLADYQWYSITEQVLFPFLLWKHKCDLLHFPHFNVPILYFGSFVVTIHDLILLHFPTKKNTTLHPFVYGVKYFAYKYVIRHAIRKSQHIFATSEFTKNDILKNYSVSSKKITVTYQAADFPHFDSSVKKHPKHAILTPYVFYVGNAYPHKNLERLIESFCSDDVQKHGWKLVMVGKDDFFYRRLKEHARSMPSRFQNSIIFWKSCTDEELAQLYAGASLYAMPSLYEGFGLTPLEAMSQRVPVVASRHTCTHEILGDAAEYFDGENVGSIRDVLARMMDNVSLREEYSNKGIEKVSEYSWDRLARGTRNMYVTVLSNRG